MSWGEGGGGGKLSKNTLWDSALCNRREAHRAFFQRSRPAASIERACLRGREVCEAAGEGGGGGTLAENAIVQ